MRLIQTYLSAPALAGVLLALTALAINPIAHAEGALANPYKLDLRTATDEQMKTAIAYASRDRVTIVAFAGTDAPWRIVQDVGDQLAAQGIPVTLAWANDTDDDIQSANVIIFAKGQSRYGVEYSTKVGYINYRIRVEKGAVERLVDKAKDAQREFF